MENHPQNPKNRISRILLTFDSTTRDTQLLDSVAELAARLDAELSGLYIEDIKLLNLSALPFAREIVYGATQHRKLERASLERALSTQANQLREAIALAAARISVRHSFATTRGEFPDALLSLASTGDLLILEKSSLYSPQAHAIIDKATYSIVLLNQLQWPGTPVMVFFENTENSRHALQLAARLIGSKHKQLIIVLPAEKTDDARKLKDRATALIQPYDINADFITLAENNIEKLLNIINQTHTRLFIFDAAGSPWISGDYQKFLNNVGYSVIFFR